ncbi:MAG TPA: penicillin-binding protein [Myxococcota bacterium]|nr:penicillin-binding protein [Myxococcota bacterium]
MRRSARRVEVALGLLGLAFLALTLRAAHLSVFDERGAARGDAQSLRTLILPPSRGEIVDRSGASLALSVDAPSIYAQTKEVADPATAARGLARVLGVDARELAKRFSERRGFQFVARWVTPEQAERVHALGLAGIGIAEEPRRVYPYHRLAASTLGFANIDGTGVRGIEQQEDSWLRGTTRRMSVERDGSGRLLPMQHGTPRGTSGGDLMLTLDATLQADAERELAEEIRATGARGGVVIALDPHTGDILSLAEAPSFDPNHFRELDYGSTRSSAFLDASEPGSSFKAFLVAAALDKGAITADEKIDCGDGSLRVPGKTIHDKEPRGVLDPAGILRVSSNIGAVHIAYALGPSDHYEMLRRFGFGEITGSGFPDESAGVLRSWKEWRPVDHATIAYGQGISVTPIQLAAALGALANGGEWLAPRLVAARRAPGGPWLPTPPARGHRVVSPATAASVLRMMESVVGEGGTGVRAALPGIRVAGKTGTAQKFDTREGRYSQQRFRSWFVGVAPADAPRIVIVVGLDEPKRPYHTGGMSAAPLFAAVARSQLAQQGIHVENTPALIAQADLPDEGAEAEDDAPHVGAGPPVHAPAPRPEPPAPRPVAAAAAKPAPAPAPQAPQTAAPVAAPAGDVEVASFRGRVLLPDFRGLSLEEVTRITASQGLQVKVQGRGRAVAQEPPPGTILPAGGAVRVLFDGSQAAEPRVGGARSG